LYPCKPLHLLPKKPKKGLHLTHLLKALVHSLATTIRSLSHGLLSLILFAITILEREAVWMFWILGHAGEN
jgi:hypothetical protein